MAVNAAAMIAVALYFRVRSLGNIPGLNGDEAWYGVQALQLLRDGTLGWRTPTGNLLNPLFFGPLVLLHLGGSPSVVALRCVAVAGGVAALAANWLLCRWVYDRPTAAISTVLLAVLPVNIAYSRFAWDASQSLLVTVAVWYLCMAALRFPQRQGRWMAAAVACQLAALVVHPANVFAAAAIAAVAALRLGCGDLKRLGAAVLRDRRAAAGLLLVLVGAAAAGVCWLRTPGPSVVAGRLVGPRALMEPGGLARAAVLYPRLLAGGTIYRYLAGADSWGQWPNEERVGGWGVDTVLVWGSLAAAVWLLRRSWKQGRREQDRAWLAAWALQLVTLVVLAGPLAMAPGYERYAIGLVGPAVVLVARAAALAIERRPRCGRVALTAAAALGWLMLADFHTHYFEFIEQTGGRAHETFRTAAEEPKSAALRVILQRRQPGPVWIVAPEYWSYWPLRYLAWNEPEVHIIADPRTDAPAEFDSLVAQGRVWGVAYWGGEALERVRADLAGREVWEESIPDYAGQPVLGVLRATAEPGRTPPPGG